MSGESAAAAGGSPRGIDRLLRLIVLSSHVPHPLRKSAVSKIVLIFAPKIYMGSDAIRHRARVAGVLGWGVRSYFFSKVSKRFEEGFIGTTGEDTGGLRKSLNWKR